MLMAAHEERKTTEELYRPVSFFRSKGGVDWQKANSYKVSGNNHNAGRQVPEPPTSSLCVRPWRSALWVIRI
jgi:hypothetical protein